MGWFITVLVIFSFFLAPAGRTPALLRTSTIERAAVRVSKCMLLFFEVNGRLQRNLVSWGLRGMASVAERTRRQWCCWC
ncbi:hypothetical protein V8F20_007839 [Naviculisporaceae sp. PSN 640]